MTQFESGVKQVAYPQEKVFEMLSDLSNIDRVKDRLPEDKFKNLSFDRDSVSISMEPVGNITLNIVELKCTIQADLNPFIKPMVSGPLQEALDKMADALSMIPYE